MKRVFLLVSAIFAFATLTPYESRAAKPSCYKKEIAALFAKFDRYEARGRLFFFLDKSTQKNIEAFTTRAHHAGHDSSPAAQYLVTQIERGAALRYSRELAILGEVKQDKGLLQITIDTFNTRPGSLLDLARADTKLSPEFHAGFSKLMTGLFDGISSLLLQDPTIRVVRIDVGLVVNNELKRAYSDLGFVATETGLALTPSELAGGGKYLSFKVRPKLID